MYETKNNRDWYIGGGLIALSSLCGALGNSLEPMSPFIWLHLVALVIGYEQMLASQMKERTLSSTLITLVYIVFIEAIGFTVGFAGTIGETTTTESILQTYIFGLFIWTCYAIFALLPHYLYDEKYPLNLYLSFVLPIGYTIASHSIIGPMISTFPLHANGLVDYTPIRQLSSIFGLPGITFLSILLVTSGCLCHLQKVWSIFIFKCTITIIIILLCISCFIENKATFYQKDISTLILNTIPVSCITSRNVLLTSNKAEHLWQSTQDRLLADDIVVLWSEEAVGYII